MIISFYAYTVMTLFKSYPQKLLIYEDLKNQINVE